MDWLQALDVGLFRFINITLSNPVFDRVMPFVSGNPLFFPVLAVAAALLIWKGRARAIICMLMLAVIVSLGDGLICRTMKEAVGRERPFWVLHDAHCLLGKTRSGSMPSSHAANWFAATMVALIYYRRSAPYILALACLVGFSRIYNGVHYPSDVLAGGILGAGYAAAAIWALNAGWRWAGQKWFPLWWQQMPSLVQCGPPSAESRWQTVTTREDPGDSGFPTPHSALDSHWLRLGYLLIAALLLARLAYIASGTIQLSEDEAYQWIWSKHLAPSYYSKPPLIAYTQFLGTRLWGDTEFGVRFFSPVIAAILSFIVVRLFSREVNARTGFILLLIVTAAPLLSLGSVLMTVDPLSVLFWTAAMVAGWRAIQQDARTRDWLWVGLWMGLGFLSKYTELFQLLCWAVFFILWPSARKHLRRPGPYLALGINFFCALPVVIWNAQHGWVTVQHVGQNAAVGTVWKPTLRYFGEFLGSEIALLHPIFFVGMIWAAIAFWRRARQDARMIYFFSMGAPLFVIYLLYTFHSRVLPNWIAPSVVPLFCLMAAYWHAQWQAGIRSIKRWLISALVVGLAAVIVGHNTDLVKKMTGRFLPVNLDPLHRVRGWSDVARMAGEARGELLAEGKPVFIIADHYGLVGQISFYLPEAKAAVTEAPLVKYQSSARPRNQFYFWPGYNERKGENAIFIHELNRDQPKLILPPADLLREFESVQELGVRTVLYHGRVLRPFQVFACRGLR
jgi:membrane-associated phospholipid phosphatase